MKSIPFFLFKILAILAVISLLYLVFFIFPKEKEKKMANLNYTNLLQNRLAYVELIKLDPQSPNYKSQQVDLIARIKETNQKGLESSKEEVKKIMQIQKEIMNELSGAETYEEGIAILKSEKSVTLLTRQTNLLLELERLAKR